MTVVVTVVAATTVVAEVETGVVVTGERKDRVRGKGKGLE